MSKETPSKPQSGNTKRPVVEFEYDTYAHYLDDTELTEDQKQEYLQVLWNIIADFVALGFNVHPIQQAKNACGKLSKSHGESGLTASDVLKSKPQLKHSKFNKAAFGTPPNAPERIQK